MMKHKYAFINNIDELKTVLGLLWSKTRNVSYCNTQRNATHSRQTNVRRFERQVRQVTYKTYYARHIRRISCYELAQHTAQHTAQQTAQQTAQHTASEEEMEHCIVA